MQDAPHDTRVFREVAALGSELASLSGLAGAAIPSPVAVVWDVHSDWARQINSALNTVERPRVTAHAWHRTFWDARIGADVVDAAHDLASYRLIIVPGVFLLRPGFAARLEAAARAGAQVLIDGLSAWVDDDFACVEGGRPGPLRAALGLRCEEFDQLRADERLPIADPHDWFGTNAQVQGWADRIHAEGCEVLARLSAGFHQDWPLLTRRVCGAGACWYLAGGLEANARAHFISRLTALASIAPCLPDLPPGVPARERTQPDRRYVFLHNPQDHAVRVPLAAGWTDAVSGAEQTGGIDLAPWDARTVVRTST